VVQRWQGQDIQFQARQAVLVGFPSDEGVRRNHGRPGASEAPDVIRDYFYRLTSWDALAQADIGNIECLDLGNLRIDKSLAQAQEDLGQLIGAILQSEAAPIILGGGHETAFGHYLGYVAAGVKCGIINVDAHLDVRSYEAGPHSGSPFRQALEHQTHPLKSGGYVVLGAQRQSVAQAHCRYVLQRGGRIHWQTPDMEVKNTVALFCEELDRLAHDNEAIMVSVDADAFHQADVPGVSAPNPCGLDGRVFPEIAFQAGLNAKVRSLDLVEINPQFDRDGQSARWAALGIRQFLVGLALRGPRPGH
jgi:formiminoglutamase